MLELSLRFGQCGYEKRAIETMEELVRRFPDNQGAAFLLESMKNPEQFEKQLMESMPEQSGQEGVPPEQQ